MADDEPRGPIVVSVAALTNVGMHRSVNEDAFALGEIGGALAHTPSEACPTGEHTARITLASGLVLGVYDGMGGGSSGDSASRDAAHVVHTTLAEEPLPRTEDELRDRLSRAVGQANRAVFLAGQNDRRRLGSGTTATIAALVDACAVIAQAGDSRAYLLRGRRLVPVTRDDRLTAELVRQASPDVTEEQLASLPTNVITKALGMREDMDASITRVILRRDDVLLLCSDGLWGLVSDPTIRAVLLRQRSPGAACRVLCEEALRAGGADNVTIIVARFDGEGLRPPIRAETVVT
ncbi:MAG: SpoIIE family protein phosphatase [Minicystis sp.]